jgi:uncharacterized protein YkwD
MSGRLVHGWLFVFLIGYLALPVPAWAQIVEPEDSHAIQPGSSASNAPDSSVDLKQTAEQILSLTNHFRAQHGRGELKSNPELTRAAQDFADYLARTDTFSHTADGKRPSQRVREHGYSYCLVAENIAEEYNSSGFTTQSLASALVTGWRHSPEHRKNMLDGDLEDLGVGVARSQRTGRYYSVQDFGRPKEKAIVFKITNETEATIHYTLEDRTFALNPHFTITHTRCRPPELDFQNVHGKGEEAKDEDEVFHPKNGSHYVIRGSGDNYTVEKE